MKRLFVVLFLLIAASAYAQIGPPSVPTTGSLGAAGNFPFCNAGSLNFSADANVTMGAPQPSACTIKLTSTVTLTATRNLYAPLFFGSAFTLYNDTAGGQVINVCGSTGSCAPIPNDGLPHWAGSDGLNYYLLGSGSTAGVSSINSATGGITLTGDGVTQSGNTFTFSAQNCALGACIQNNPTSAQQITQPNNYGLTLSATNTGNYSPNPLQIYIQNKGPGYDCGNNGSACSGWSTTNPFRVSMASNARGIDQVFAYNMAHSGQGDTAGIYGYVRAFGGGVASSDEQVDGMVLQTGQKGFPAANAAGSPAVGATNVTTNSFACFGTCDGISNNSWDDGGIFLVVSQPGTTATVATVGVANGGLTYTITGGTVTPSSAVGNLIASTCTPNGNGQWQVYMQTSCNVNLVSGTFVVSGSQTSCAAGTPIGTALDIGLVGGFQEEAYVVAVGTPSGGVQNITFCTRYAWNNSNGGFVGQGGPLGQALVQTGASWPIAIALAGAINSTTLVGSNCLLGQCYSGNNQFSAGTALTFYPMGFITGSPNGSSSVNLGTNHMAVVNGDRVLGAPTSAYGQIGIRLAMNQNTPGTAGGIQIDDNGPIFGVPLEVRSGASGSPAPNGVYLNGYFNNPFLVGQRPAVGPLLGVGNGAGASYACYGWIADASSYGALTYCPVPNTLGFTGPFSAPTYTESPFTPSSSSATCTTGEWTDDSNYHYFCTSTNHWVRSAYSTF